MVEKENNPAEATMELANKWLDRVKKAKEHHKKKWGKQARKAQDIYECKEKEKAILPILSNIINVQQGAIITRNPDVIISSTNDLTYADDITAQVYEKALQCYVKESDLGTQGIKACKDYLIAMGVIRVDRYEGEKVTFSHVPWNRLTMQPANNWNETEWICFEHFIDKEGLTTEYDVHVSEEYEEHNEHIRYEIWCKKTGLIYIVSPSVDDLLEMVEPTWRHKGFFPIPAPRLLDCKSDEFEPNIEFSKWEQLHTIVQQITKREKGLIKSIQAINFYDQTAFKEVSNLEDSTDNEYIPIDGDKIRGQGGQLDLNTIVVTKDNISAVTTLQQLNQYKEQTLSKIYQLTGVSNEMMQGGVNDLKETATAQRIKQGWGTSRLEVKRRDIHTLLRDCLVLAGEIMSQGDQQELIQQSGVELNEEQSMQLMEYVANGGINAYTFDIETATTIAIDQQAEQESKNKLIENIASISNTLMQPVQSGLIPYSVYVQLLKSASTGLSGGRDLKDEFDSMAKNQEPIQQMQQQIQELTQQIQQKDMEAQAMQYELSKRDEADMNKVRADTDLKDAQTLKTDVETIHKASEKLVEPDVMYDEQIAIQGIKQPQQPINYQ